MLQELNLTVAITSLCVFMDFVVAVRAVSPSPTFHHLNSAVVCLPLVSRTIKY